MVDIAVIPARGGSKRVPRKNIRLLDGKPVISYSISTALESNLFDHVIVSTDDQEIAQVSRAHGAEVPFLRDQNLADDFTGLREVVGATIYQTENHFGEKVNSACCIYPIAPFMRADDLIKAESLLLTSDAAYALAVARFEKNPFRSVKIDGNQIKLLFPEFSLTRTQDLLDLYFDAAFFAWGKRDSWFDATPILSSNTAPVIVPTKFAIDVDTEDDWEALKMAFAHLNRPET